MNIETKQCPLCAETIPLAAATCEFCGARFEVTSTGYCVTCHDVRDADENGKCKVCGNAVVDLHVESRLIEEQARELLPIPQPTAQTEISKTGKSHSPIGILAGILIFTVIGAFLWFGRNILFATPDPTATLTSPITFTPSSTPDFAATDQSATATAQAALAGTLTLWHSYPPGSTDENALLVVIRNAEAENPGLHVIATYHPSENLSDLDKYTAAVSAGNGPDILLAWNEKVGDMVRAGVFLNLQGYITADHLAGIQQYALDGLTIDGKLYGLPETSNIVAVYYNKTLLPTPPATTDNMLSLIKAGKTMEIIGYSPYWLFGFWSGFGVQIQDESGRCDANQRGFIPAVQYILDLQKAGTNFQFDYEAAQNRFLERKANMLINGSWALTGYEEALGKDLGVVILPSGPAGPSRPITGVSGFFINPKSAKPEVAFLLIQYMTSQASAQIFTDQAGHIPVRNDVSISNPLLSTFSMAASLGTSRAENKQFDNYWDPFTKMFQDVLSGAATPQAAIQRACESMNSLNGVP